MHEVINNIPVAKGMCLNTFEFYYPVHDPWMSGIVKNHYETFESLLILSQTKENDVVIDVGASIGYYSLLLASRVGQNGKVYAFEPNPAIRAILERNVQINKLNNIITILDSAIADQSGIANLYLSVENQGDHRLFSDQDENVARESLPIQTISLDEFWNSLGKIPISLIKIDTQGYEPFVIKGASEVIKACHPSLFFEYWPYGYKRSNANAELMKHFLRSEYGNINFIDREYKRLFIVQDALLERFCIKNQGLMHSDLFCSMLSIERILDDLEKKRIYFPIA